MPKTKPQKHIFILWGLPGSGKTHYAEENSASANPSPFDTNSSLRIDIDCLSKKSKKLIEELTFKVLSSKKSIQKVYLDGLITTHTDANNIISAINESNASSYNWDLHYHMVES